MTRGIAVLHLLPHCGGGVGTVLRSLLEAEVSTRVHPVPSVATLECINEPTRRRFNALGIPWVDCLAVPEGREQLTALITKADIVLVHWWNHPLLMRLLFHGLPPSRLALWSHVNGFSEPQSFFPELFGVSDRFVFATKASWQSPVVTGLPADITHRLRVIRSCAGVPTDAIAPVAKQGPFQFGYVGTVEPAKMHPNFLELCAAAQVSSRCIVAGGPAHNELRSRAEQLGIANQFDIRGPVDDPRPIYRRLHAFAYPLNPTHYGSGEQVLIEAMAYGALPVVLNNPPEQSLIRPDVTGLIAANAEEFTNAIRFLSTNPTYRQTLAEAARQFVVNECDIAISVKAFASLFVEMLSLPKRPHTLSLPSFDGIQDGSPFHLFLASCGSDATRNHFTTRRMTSDRSSCPADFTSTTRGTPHHYLRLLGHDPGLERVCRSYRSDTKARS